MLNPVKDLSVLRVSTLIHQLDSAVRVQAVNTGNLQSAGNKDGGVKFFFKREKTNKITRSNYAIGVGLVEFLVERGLITLKTDKSYTKELSFSKRMGYLQLNCYAMLNFDLSNLPIKLNLPMVSKPLPWRSKVDVPLTLADIEGGYLTGLTGDVFNRFRLLTSKNLDNFYLQLKDPKRLCDVLNTLKSQDFEINEKVLKFIVSNRDTLEEVGLLMDRRLAKVSLPKETY